MIADLYAQLAFQHLERVSGNNGPEVRFADDWPDLMDTPRETRVCSFDSMAEAQIAFGLAITMTQDIITKIRGK